MKLRFGHLARRVALPLVALALLVGPLAAAIPGTALAQTPAEDAYNTARDALQRSDYTAAVDAFSRAIGVDPNMAQAYVGRATAYVYEGNLQGAIADFNRALQIDPNLPEALYNRGVLLAQSGDAQGAIRDLQQAADLFRQRGDEATAGLVSQAIESLQP
jgi:tetratricopeptide (TPR) repeat protein